MTSARAATSKRLELIQSGPPTSCEAAGRYRQANQFAQRHVGGSQSAAARKNPIAFGMPPDLFGLTDATSKRSRPAGWSVDSVSRSRATVRNNASKPVAPTSRLRAFISWFDTVRRRRCQVRPFSGALVGDEQVVWEWRGTESNCSTLRFSVVRSHFPRLRIPFPPRTFPNELAKSAMWGKTWDTRQFESNYAGITPGRKRHPTDDARPGIPSPFAS